MNIQDMNEQAKAMTDNLRKLSALKPEFEKHHATLQKAQERYKVIEQKKAIYKGKRVTLQLLACNAVIIAFEDMGEHKQFFDSIK